MSEMYDEDQPWHLTQEPDGQPSYEELADRIEELKAENKRIRLEVVHANDTADVAINQVRILAGMLEKAVEALKKLHRRQDTLDTFDAVVDEIVSTTLAELKGHDDG